MSNAQALPPETFDRLDDTPDEDFYRVPRLVAHIDPGTIAALTTYYAEALAEADAVLDLMSSWISHLPDRPRFSRVAGLGMNEVELATNSRLDERVVHDLNADPVLPFASASFDAVVNAVSVQYLTRPAEVFSEVARVLRPGGISIVAMSHRCFPTKAIRAFHSLTRDGRFDLVSRYHTMASGFEPAASSTEADPVSAATVRGRDSTEGSTPNGAIRKVSTPSTTTAAAATAAAVQPKRRRDRARVSCLQVSYAASRTRSARSTGTAGRLPAIFNRVATSSRSSRGFSGFVVMTTPWLGSGP